MVQIVLYVIGVINLLFLVCFLILLYFLVPFGDFPPFFRGLKYEDAEFLRRFFINLWLMLTPLLSSGGLYFRKMTSVKSITIIHITAIVVWCPVAFIAIFTLIKYR